LFARVQNNYLREYITKLEGTKEIQKQTILNENATTTKYDNPTNTIIVSPIPVNPSWQGTNTLTNGLSLRGFGSMDVTISDYGNFRYEFKLQCSTATGYTATRTFIVNHQMSGGGVIWGAFTVTLTIVQVGGDAFVDLNGDLVGPFSKGSLVNVDKAVADILSKEGRATLVDSFVS
jgi:hypothetical protein